MDKLERDGFCFCFVVGPVLFAGIIPTMIFGLFFDQAGSNLLWGTYFGLGWCLSAFWSGRLVHDDFSTRIGFAWGWLAIIPLYTASRHLHAKLDERGRQVALKLLFATFLLDVPFGAIMFLEKAGLHLPDYMSHLALSF